METVPLPQRVLDLAVSRLPADVQAGLRRMGPRAVLAGGYLRSLATQEYPVGRTRGLLDPGPKDIDIFVPDLPAASELSTLLLDAGRRCVGYQKYSGGMPAWRGAVTFKELPGESAEVQVIGEWKFDSPATVIEQFDFRVSAAAMWWNGHDWEGITHDAWVRDIMYGHAHYNASAPNPAGTLLRLNRYLGLGYSLCPEELAWIAVRAVAQTEEWEARHSAAYRRKARTGRDLADAMYDMCQAEMISPPSVGVPFWYEPAGEPGMEAAQSSSPRSSGEW